MPRPSRRYEDLTPVRRRRLEAALLARSVIVGVLLFVAYYLLPLNKPEDFGVALLVGGLILVAAVIAWQVRAWRLVGGARRRRATRRHGPVAVAPTRR